MIIGAGTGDTVSTPRPPGGAGAFRRPPRRRGPATQRLDGTWQGLLLSPQLLLHETQALFPFLHQSHNLFPVNAGFNVLRENHPQGRGWPRRIGLRGTTRGSFGEVAPATLCISPARVCRSCGDAEGQAGNPKGRSREQPGPDGSLESGRTRALEVGASGPGSRSSHGRALRPAKYPRFPPKVPQRFAPRKCHCSPLTT